MTDQKREWMISSTAYDDYVHGPITDEPIKVVEASRLDECERELAKLREAFGEQVQGMAETFRRRESDYVSHALRLKVSLSAVEADLAKERAARKLAEIKLEVASEAMRRSVDLADDYADSGISRPIRNGLKQLERMR